MLIRAMSLSDTPVTTGPAAAQGTRMGKPSAPEDDAARQVAHVQAAGHLLEVVLPRVVAARVQLPILLQPRQRLRRVVRPLLNGYSSLQLE